MTTTKFKDALTEAFNARGFDAPTITDVSRYGSTVILLCWGIRNRKREAIEVFLSDDAISYSLPRHRMTRQGGRLEAIREAAKAMGLNYQEA